MDVNSKGKPKRSIDPAAEIGLSTVMDDSTFEPWERDWLSKGLEMFRAAMEEGATNPISAEDVKEKFIKKAQLIIANYSSQLDVAANGRKSLQPASAAK
jgi:hypothetical protein